MTNIIKAYRKYLTINDIVYDYNLVRFRHIGGNMLQPFYVNAPNVNAGGLVDLNLGSNIVYYNDDDSLGLATNCSLSIINAELLCAHLNFIAKDSEDYQICIRVAYIALNNSFPVSVFYNRYDKYIKKLPMVTVGDMSSTFTIGYNEFVDEFRFTINAGSALGYRDETNQTEVRGYLVNTSRSNWAFNPIFFGTNKEVNKTYRFGVNLGFNTAFTISFNGELQIIGVK